MSFCNNGKVDQFDMEDPSEWLKRLTLNVANKQRAEMEQAMRNLLQASGDTGKKDDESSMPFNSGFGAPFQNEPVKILQGRDVKRGTVTPPPGLGDPMKIRCSREEEGAHLQWHKPATNHVTISAAPSPTATLKPRFCTQCGEKVPPGFAKAKFCTSCGNEHPNMDAIHHHDGHMQTARTTVGYAEPYPEPVSGALQLPSKRRVTAALQTDSIHHHNGHMQTARMQMGTLHVQ